MLMIGYTFIVLQLVLGDDYCETRECPGFSLVTLLKTTEVSAETIEIVWKPKKDYDVIKYEVHWYSDPNCETSVAVNETTLKIYTEPCKNYTFEVYPFESNSTIPTAPAIITQISVADCLKNGSAVLIGERWTVLRWLLTQPCPNSTHLTICYGPNIATQTKIQSTDGVVIFNMSGLSDNSNYMCVAYTLNQAGSSLPSPPVIFRTKKAPRLNGVFEYGLLIIPSIVLLCLLCLLLLLIHLLKEGRFGLPWKRTYSMT